MAECWLHIFLDEASADVLFEVHPPLAIVDEADVDQQRRTLAPARFFAHRHILCNCEVLRNRSNAYNSLEPIPITDTAPDMFRRILYYIYGGEISIIWMYDHAEEMIDAAFQYDIGTLKIEAETWYRIKVKLTIDNVVDCYQYAVSRQLKTQMKVIQAFVVENEAAILDMIPITNNPGFHTMVVDSLTESAEATRSSASRQLDEASQRNALSSTIDS